MYKHTKKIYSSALLIAIVVLCFGLFVPQMSHAQTQQRGGVQCLESKWEAACKNAGATWDEDTEVCPDPNRKYRCLVGDPTITLNTPLPGGSQTVQNIDQYIETLFTWLLRVGGVVAALVLVWGGYVYITAAGNQARMSMAKEIILGGIIGIILLFGSVTLLGFVNNRLVSTTAFKVDYIFTKNLAFTLCEQSESRPDSGQISTVTCGQSITTSDGKSCLSTWCGTASEANGGNLACLPAEVGGSVSVKQGYKCIELDSFRTMEYLIDSCKVARGLQQTQFVAGYIEDKKPGYSCGLNNDNTGVYGEIVTCASSEVGRLNCNLCGISSDDNTKRFEAATIDGGILTEDLGWFDNPKEYLAKCADAGQTQVEYSKPLPGAEDFGAGYYKLEIGAICCGKSDETTVLRVQD